MQQAPESAFRPYLRQDVNSASNSPILPGYSSMDYGAYSSPQSDLSPSYPTNSGRCSAGGKEKSRRVRTQFSWKQLEILEKEYSKHKYPDMTKRYVISEAAGLNDNQVKIWFQNRRSKEKKDTGAVAVADVKSNHSASPPTTSSAPSPHPNVDANLVVSTELPVKKESVLVSMLNSPPSTQTSSKTPTPTGSVSPQVVPTTGNYLDMQPIDRTNHQMGFDGSSALTSFTPYMYDLFAPEYSPFLAMNLTNQMLPSMAFDQSKFNQEHINNDLTRL